jgi:hypothetical protein
VQKLLDYPAHGVMKLWLSQQYALPAGLLFVPGKRYHEIGWGWAPLRIVADSIVDDTCIARTTQDTYLQVVKPGFLVQLHGTITASGFVFMHQEKEQRLRVKLEQVYKDVITDDYRPPLPKRPSDKEAPPLPPRPMRPAISDSTQHNTAASSKESIPRPSVYSSNTPAQSTASFTSQGSTASQKGLKRKIPGIGEMFGLVLAKVPRLSGLHDGKAAGALITLGEKDTSRISGLFICSVIVDVVGDEVSTEGSVSATVQALPEEQVWVVG